MPAPNAERRAVLADTAIALLAEQGVHGLTHRSVERRAGLPDGTASNYFRSREALLVAAAERILTLHEDHVSQATRTNRRRTRGGDPVVVVTRLLAESLLEAVTLHRERYLAMFELRLESRRSPALAAALDNLAVSTRTVVERHHADLELAIPTASVPVLMANYGGLLFTLVTEPDAPALSAIRHLVEPVVRGLLAP